MIYLRTGHKLTALTLSIATLCSPAFSQEGTGARGTLSFSQGIEIENGDVASRTELGFGISSATRTETFSFNIGTEIFGDLSNGDGQTFNFINENAAVRYSRLGSTSRLSFSAIFDQVELDDDVIEGLGGATVISTGVAETTSFELGFDFGVGTPVEVETNIGRRKISYSGTSDPDLFDFESTTADVLARFRISPALTARALAGISRTVEDDLTSTEREETYVGVGAETMTATGLSITADLIYDRSEVTVAGPSTTEEDGLGIEFGVSQARPNGTLGFSLSSRIDDNGRRTAAEVNRDFDLRQGAMEVSFGVVDQEGDDDLRLIGAVALERETKRGAITASLTQDSSSSDGDSVISTNVNLGITQEINKVSSWSAGLGFSASDELGGEYDSRSTASISYTRDLTTDWDMSAGIEYSKDRDASSTNTIFFNIERDITFGF